MSVLGPNIRSLEKQSINGSAWGRRCAGFSALASADVARGEGARRSLRAAFAGDERIRRVLRIPGIGFFTAAVVLAEVGELGRFSSPDQLASWAGLTPTERSSDEHTRRGHISK
jgi:transposase